MEQEQKRAKKSRGAARLPSVEVPDWIDPACWAGYLEMRLLIRKPPTQRALGLCLWHLARLRDAGQDPNAVLDQSTQHSWQGLFAVRDAPQVQLAPNASADPQALRAWGEVRAALRDGMPRRRWSDSRTQAAVDALGWAALDGMRSDQALHYQREFCRVFCATPVVPRAEVFELRPQTNRRVA